MNARQARFCEEYLVDLNATQAAIRAGYSANTAESTASRLLRNAKVSTRIAELSEKRSEATGRKAEDVVRRLWQIVEVDPRRAFDENGNMLHPSKLPDDIAAALASLEVGDAIKIKLNDRMKALDLLGRHHALFVERIEQTTTHAKVVIQIPENNRGD